METTLQVLNDLERTGVVRRYAIGGAMGATFYVEPVLTFDLDVFVVLPQTGGGPYRRITRNAVIPAHAGIQSWVPASAGTTKESALRSARVPFGATRGLAIRSS